MKASVITAKTIARLTPFCLYYGPVESYLTRWMSKNGVTVIHHIPSWSKSLLQIMTTAKKNNLEHSHLFATEARLISTFQRIDIPMAPVLDQFSHILYTDVDCYFRKEIRLSEFNPLPDSMFMAYEDHNNHQLNAGVYLANLLGLRSTYKVSF
jgi:hypothetical protein